MTNRGRHKKIQFPYNNFITLRIFFITEPNQSIVHCDYVRTFETEKQLKATITSYKNSSNYNIYKIQVMFKGKLLKTY